MSKEFYFLFFFLCTKSWLSNVVQWTIRLKRRDGHLNTLYLFILFTKPFLLKGCFYGWRRHAACMQSMLLDQWSLAVSLGQSQSQVLQELVEGEVDLRSEVSRVVHGNDQHDVVGQHLKKKKITYVYDINWGVLILL